MLYRQLAHKLRVQGRTPETSVRPRHEKSKRYLDSDDEPTLIELGPSDPVDVEWLLQIGAIAPYTPPKKSAKEVPSGQDRGLG